MKKNRKKRGQKVRLRNSTRAIFLKVITNQLKEKQAAQAIAVINNLIIPDSGKLILKMIAKKIYQSIKLTQEETTFWNSCFNSEKSYILTGVTAQFLDFAKYQKAGFSVEIQPQEIIVQEEQHWQEPNLFFEPSSSDSDSSEDPDYIPPVPLKRIIATSDDSWPDNSNSNPLINLLHQNKRVNKITQH